MEYIIATNVNTKDKIINFLEDFDVSKLKVYIKALRGINEYVTKDFLQYSVEFKDTKYKSVIDFLNSTSEEFKRFSDFIFNPTIKTKDLNKLGIDNIDFEKETVIFNNDTDELDVLKMMTLLVPLIPFKIEYRKETFTITDLANKIFENDKIKPLRAALVNDIVTDLIKGMDNGRRTK